MTDRPIIFSAAQVRALLAGTKTQTRRIVKPQEGVEIMPEDYEFGVIAHRPCPYGEPGDRLWVRETWRVCRSWDDTKPGEIEPFQAVRYDADEHEEGIPKMGWGKTRVSIFMPRWAGRITLEVVSVRVERLQDISEEDAKAEGIECTHRDEDRTFWKNYRFEGPIAKRGKVWTPEENQIVNYNREPIRSYQSLWESINGSGSWDANPWVWVVSFKVLPRTGDHGVTAAATEGGEG